MFIESLVGDHSWTKGGLMIRESLDDNAKHFMVVLTGSNGLRGQYRTATGGNMDSFSGASISNAPLSFKITKRGDVFQG